MAGSSSASTLKAALLVPCVLHAWRQSVDQQAQDAGPQAHLPSLDRPQWPCLLKALLRESTYPDPDWPDVVDATITKEQYQAVLQRLCTEALGQRVDALTYRAWTVRLVVALLLMLSTTMLLLPHVGLALILLPALILGPALGILVVLELDASSSLKSSWRLEHPPASQQTQPLSRGSSAGMDTAAAAPDRPAASAPQPHMGATGVTASFNAMLSISCNALDSASVDAAVMLERGSPAQLPSAFHRSPTLRSSADGTDVAANAAATAPRSPCITGRPSRCSVSSRASARTSISSRMSAARTSISSRMSAAHSLASRLSCSSFVSRLSAHTACSAQDEAGVAAADPGRVSPKLLAQQRQQVLSLATQVHEVLVRRSDEVREDEVQALYDKMKGDELRTAVELDEAAQQQQQQLLQYAQSVTFKLPNSGCNASGRLVGTAADEVEVGSLCSASHQPHAPTRFKPGLGASGKHPARGSHASDSLDAGSSADGHPWGRDSSSTRADGRSMSCDMPAGGAHQRPASPSHRAPPADTSAGGASSTSQGSSQAGAAADKSMTSKLGALFGRKRKQLPGLKQHVLGRMARKAVEEAQARAAEEARRVMAWKEEGTPAARPGRVFQRNGVAGLYFQENISRTGAITHTEPTASDQDDDDDDSPLNLLSDELDLDPDESLDLGQTLLGSVGLGMRAGPPPALPGGGLLGTIASGGSASSMSSMLGSPVAGMASAPGPADVAGPSRSISSGKAGSKLLQAARKAVKKMKSRISQRSNNSSGGASSTSSQQSLGVAQKGV